MVVEAAAHQISDQATIWPVGLCLVVEEVEQDMIAALALKVEMGVDWWLELAHLDKLGLPLYQFYYSIILLT